MEEVPISLLSIFNGIEFHLFNADVLFSFLTVLLLIFFSAFISGAEVAFFSLTPSVIEQAKESEPKRTEKIERLLKQPKRLLATILVANNFINIAIVLLFAYLGNFIFEDISSLLIRFIVEVLLVTFLILFFGEILPKIYASRNRIKFVKFMAYPLRFLDIIISPLSLPMRRVIILIQKILGKQKSSLSVDQLSQALELASEDDTTKEEQKILQGIVSFGNTDTKQVMQPRIDIFALDESLKFSEIFPDIIENGFSRIPVFKDNIDTIVGVLYVKDLLPHLSRKEFNWNSLLRAPFFVPENKKLDDLMVEFQEKKVHLAIVVDEYGGTSGIVALEDVIEEIVGDISDEFDDDDITFSRIDDYNFVFEGKTNLKDFYRIVKIEDESIFEIDKGESETIAGFVLEISGGFPKKGSKINFKNYQFLVEAIDKKRIRQIKVTLPNT